MKVTDKKGKFIGGAAVARRKKGNKILNPMVRETLRSGIGRHVHPQERMMAAILRTMPRDIMKSHHFPFYREQLRSEMCERVQLPPLAPLKAKYKDMKEYNQIHASMVLEEARHIIAEALYQRWGKDRIPSERGGIEMDFLSSEKMRGSEHLVYCFQAKRDLSPEMKSKLRPGTVVELMPLGQRSIENVVLGNVVRYTQRGLADVDDAEVGRQVSIMIYNKAGEKFEDGVRLVALDSLLNLTRQFDVCTTGSNDLNGEVLGIRNQGRVHTIFSYSESSDDEVKQECIEIDRSDAEVCSSSDDDSDESGSDSDESSDDDGDVVKVTSNSQTILDELQNAAPIKEEPMERRGSSVSGAESDKGSAKKPDVSSATLDISAAVKDELDGDTLAAFGYHVPRLNPTQQKAAKSFLDSTDERISIVQGPPGTGKTTLLVSVICHYLLRARQDKKKKRLLVCAPTNKAVTVLAVRVLDAIRDDSSTSTVLIGDQERLLADNRGLRQVFVYTWRSAIVDEWELVARGFQAGTIVNKDELVARAQKLINRIKRQVAGLIDDQVRTTMSLISTSLQALLEAAHSVTSTSTLCDQIKQLIKLLNNWDEREVVQTLLAEASIIFCTLSSAGAQVMKETVAVDDIIVDEAAAATAPELCVGLWLVNNRLLLVGDPHQLPATVNSEYAKHNGLDKSLQDRLMNQCGFRYTMLDIQYRMKEEISCFPFKTFYSGNVSNGDNVLESSYTPHAAVLNNQSYAFVHVLSGEHRDTLGSCYNPGECDVVVSLLQDLRHRSRHLGNDWSNVNRIRVITFYQAQVNEIRKRLSRIGLQNVLISTVDSSQGCEADIVIISFVRGTTIGFLSDYRRLNVALTRAKHQLVCVGDVMTLAALTNEKAAVVSQLAKDAIERGCVVDNYMPQLAQSNAAQGNARHSKGGEYRRQASDDIRNGKRLVHPQSGRPPAPLQVARPVSQSHNRQNFDTNWKKRNFALGTKGGRTDQKHEFNKKVKTTDR